MTVAPSGLTISPASRNWLRVLVLVLLVAAMLFSPVDAQSDTTSSSSHEKATIAPPELAFEFDVPEGMVVSTGEPGQDFLEIWSLFRADDLRDLSMEERPEIGIAVVPNPSRDSLDTWLERYYGQSEAENQESSNFSTGPSAVVEVLERASIGDEPAITFLETSFVHGWTLRRTVAARGAIVVSMFVTVDEHGSELEREFEEVVASLRWTGTIDDLPLNFTDTPLGVPSAGEDDVAEQPNDDFLGTDQTSGFRLPWRNGYRYRVVQSAGNGPTHTCPGQMCDAYDFDNGGQLIEGVPVLATRAGTVRFVRTGTTCGGRGAADSGSSVTIYHNDGTATLYLHLRQVLVQLNQSVSQGAVLGTVGKTGWTDTGNGCNPHLHMQRQAQGGWITQSRSMTFDERPGAVLARNEWVSSQNGNGGCNPPTNGIVLYEHWGYGRCYSFAQNNPDFNRLGFNDIASAIEFRGTYATGWTARLFEHTQFTGAGETFTRTDWDLGDNAIRHDRASSISLSGSGGSGGGSRPSTPSNLQAVGESTSQIRLTWNTTSGASDYYIEGHGVNRWVTGTSLLQGGYSPGATYYFRIKARNSFGESAFSSWVAGTTRSGSTGSRPSTPTNVRAEGISSSEIRVSWNSSSGATAYYVEGANAYRWVSGTSLSVGGFAPNSSVMFRVKARNSHGESASSSWVTGTTRSAGSGDACSGATSMSVGQTVRGSVGSSSRWYCFTASSGWVSIRLFKDGGSLDPIVRLYRGTQQLSWNDDEPGFTGSHSFLTHNLPASTAYRIEVSRFGTTSGSFALRVDNGRKASAADVNTDCAVNSVDNALVLGRLGGSDALGDIDLNGIVNTIDLALLQEKLGTRCP